MPVPDDKINLFQQLINEFVKGNLNLSQKTLYEKPEDGGLGLFELNTFLNSQKCAWLKRARGLNELWKLRIYSKSMGNVLNVRTADFDRDVEPVIFGIVNAYQVFFYKYTETIGYKNSFMYRNEKLTFSINSREFLTRDFFSRIFFTENRLKILDLRVRDFLEGDKIKSHLRFTQTSGIPVNGLQYGRLCGMVKTGEKKFGSRKILLDRNIESFFNFEKGSRKFRRIITRKWGDSIPHNLVKFSSNTETIINSKNGKFLNGIWNKPFFSGEMRTFFFKLHQNRLGYNYIVSKFIRGLSENCTFCEITFNPEHSRDTPLHIFWDCATVSSVVDRYFIWLLTGTNEQNPSRQEFFVNFERPNEFLNKTLSLTSKLVVFYIWQSKLRKSTPNPELLKIFTLSELRTYSILNAEIGEAVRKSGLPRLRLLGADLLNLELQ